MDFGEVAPEVASLDMPHAPAEPRLTPTQVTVHVVQRRGERPRGVPDKMQVGLLSAGQSVRLVRQVCCLPVNQTGQAGLLSAGQLDSQTGHNA